MRSLLTVVFASSLFLPTLVRAENSDDSAALDEDLFMDEALPTDLGASTMTDEKCANFAGRWKGTCNLNGKEKTKWLRVRQKGCGIVVINHRLVPIGGQKGGSVTLPKFTLAGGGSANWNEDKSALEFRGGHSAVKLATGERSWGHGGGSLKLDNGKLVVNVKGKSSKKGEFTASCSFDKQEKAQRRQE